MENKHKARRMYSRCYEYRGHIIEGKTVPRHSTKVVWHVKPYPGQEGAEPNYHHQRLADAKLYVDNYHWKKEQGYA